MKSHTEKPMKIGLYGGTFDPPHRGHEAAACAVARVLELDRLIFMPTALPPHKNEAEADSAQRLAMTALTADAVDCRCNAEVTCSDYEVARGGTSYTIETVDMLRQAHPEVELYLLTGADMFRSLHKWQAAERLLSLVTVCGFLRSAGDDDLDDQRGRLERDFNAKVILLEIPDLVEVSSTELREGLKPDLLLPQVYGYILRHGLYGAEKDLKKLALPDLRAVSYSWIYARRIAHIQGTEETAAQLARCYGADETQARRAAILHDITKYKSQAEQLQLADKYGMMLDEQTRSSKKLIHAKTGAAIAAADYGAEPAVADAIAWHTTGRANMSLLEKIIYLADYIEPNRDFEGVETVRALAGESLNAAVLKGLEQTIEELEEKGAAVHGDTLAAMESLKEGQT